MECWRSTEVRGGVKWKEEKGILLRFESQLNCPGSLGQTAICGPPVMNLSAPISCMVIHQIIVCMYFFTMQQIAGMDSL